MISSVKFLFVAGSLVGLTGKTAQAAECQIRTGTEEMLIQGTVLTPDGPLVDGQVVVGKDGLIACVGTDCEAEHPQSSKIVCEGAVISPGFINTHEHIDFSNVGPLRHEGLRYDHRHEWRKGLRGSASLETFKETTDPRVIQWGELRHLLSGTTSILGGEMVPGLVRNLDFTDGLEGIDSPRVAYATFPLNDAAGILREGDCDYGPNAATRRQVGAFHAYVAHIGEGVDAAAENEFKCLSDAHFDNTPQEAGGGVSDDILLRTTTLVHALGLTSRDLDLVAHRGNKIVWSPRSNISLYGKTLNAREAVEKGIILALGTDWLPSGSANLLREIACAQDYNASHLDSYLTAKDFWEMVTVNAAEVAEMKSKIGVLQRGAVADIVVFSGGGKDPYQSVIESREDGILLLMRGGKILLRDKTLDAFNFPSGEQCESLTIGNSEKSICVADEIGGSYTQLAAEMTQQNIYPAIFEDVPENEPSCEATR
ncbi:amidohydrolase family protein [Sinorhizobium meliloti]|nr:amidohydrolase family protein [Sinorhizobium meliloti]